MAARKNAVTLEQCLPLDRLEPHVLSERIHEILVCNRARKLWISALTLSGGGQQRLQPLTHPAQLGALAAVSLLRKRVDPRDPVGFAFILAGDTELLESPEHDVEAPVG